MNQRILDLTHTAQDAAEKYLREIEISLAHFQTVCDQLARIGKLAELEALVPPPALLGMTQGWGESIALLAQPPLGLIPDRGWPTALGIFDPPSFGNRVRAIQPATRDLELDTPSETDQSMAAFETRFETLEAKQQAQDEEIRRLRRDFYYRGGTFPIWPEPPNDDFDLTTN